MLCADYTCKGRKCNAENCANSHTRQARDIEKTDIEKIARFFKQNKHGHLSKYNFSKLDLSATVRSVMGGADRITSSKTD